MLIIQVRLSLTLIECLSLNRIVSKLTLQLNITAKLSAFLRPSRLSNQLSLASAFALPYTRLLFRWGSPCSVQKIAAWGRSVDIHITTVIKLFMFSVFICSTNFNSSARAQVPDTQIHKYLRNMTGIGTFNSHWSLNCCHLEIIGNISIRLEISNKITELCKISLQPYCI